MKESQAWREAKAEGRAEGRVEGLRDGILKLLSDRFAPLPDSVQQAVLAVDDPVALSNLLLAAARPKRLADFVRHLPELEARA